MWRRLTKDRLTDVKWWAQERSDRDRRRERRSVCPSRHKWNLFAENWGDVVETVTDVVCAGAWSVTTGLKYCASTHYVLTDTCTHTHTRTSGAFLKEKEIKCGKNGKKDIELISHPINVTDDAQHIFFLPAGTPEDPGKWTYVLLTSATWFNHGALYWGEGKVTACVL